MLIAPTGAKLTFPPLPRSRGTQMSNVCFNWKQTATPSVALTARDRERLGELQKEWDAALHDIHAARSKS
jgi:hypothetical protein